MKNLFCLLIALNVCYSLVAQNNANAEIFSPNSIEVSENSNVRKHNLTIYVDHGILAIANSTSLNVEARLYSAKSNIFHIYGRAGFGRMRTRKSTRRIIKLGGGGSSGTEPGFGPSVTFPSNSNSLGGLTSIRDIERTKSVGGIAALTILAGKNKHNFEMNLGAFLGKKLESEDDKFFPYPIFSLGYRYQKTDRILFHVKAGSQGIGLGMGVALF